MRCRLAGAGLGSGSGGRPADKNFMPSQRSTVATWRSSSSCTLVRPRRAPLMKKGELLTSLRARQGWDWAHAQRSRG